MTELKDKSERAIKLSIIFYCLKKGILIFQWQLVKIRPKFLITEDGVAHKQNLENREEKENFFSSLENREEKEKLFLRFLKIESRTRHEN